MSRVEILMTTYIGEAFVREQIDSILDQNFTDYHLTISDDHSSDGTYAILEEYSRRFPDKISIKKSPERFGNARDHFFHMMDECDADYIFFCDQDDVWFKDKLSLFMKEFDENMEVSSDLPLLVFSDQIPTDSKLNPLSESLMKYQKQNPYITSYRELIFQNVVTGGAMAIKRALRSKALECVDRKNTLMHDHWIAIVATYFGRCIYIDKPTSCYRQHSKNEVGAKKVDSSEYVKGKLSSLKSVINSIAGKKLQASVFMKTYESQLNSNDLSFLVSFSKRRSGLRFYFQSRRIIHGRFRLIGMCTLG